MKGFWEPEKRKCSDTFADMKAPLSKNKSGQNQLDSEVLFSRLLAVWSQRDVSMENVLSHELAAVPPALFYDDGRMRNTFKAHLAKKVVNCENWVPLTWCNRTICIHHRYYGIISESKWIRVTLCSQNNIFTTIGSGKNKLCCLGFRPLWSPKLSSNKRDNHVEQLEMQDQHMSYQGTQKCQITGNKATLSAFVCNYMSSSGSQRLAQEQTIIVAEVLKMPKKPKWSKSTAWRAYLMSDQDKANTRIVLHAIG